MTGLSVRAGLIVLAVTMMYGGWLVWREHAYRQAMVSLPVPAPSALTRAVAPSLPDPGALISVMGFQPADGPRPSHEPLILRGTFVSSAQDSGALLVTEQGPRVYRVGERLPGGSVLRRIEPDRVLLWRNGREEVVMLSKARQQSLNATASSTPTPSLHLRPLAAIPQSER